MTNPIRMPISELEKISGIRRSTIHYYIQYGLLQRPYKTGQTMAYYDDGHLRRLELIQKIKIEYLKLTKSSRVPLDHIQHRIKEGYSLTKLKGTGSGVQVQRKTENALRKKEEIIEATLNLYANRGYYLTNIREIAKEVGISATTFYYYFQDKRELFVETVEYVINRFKQESKEARLKEKDVTNRTRIMFRIFHENYSKIGEILNQVRAGVAIGDQWAREKLTKVYAVLAEDVKNEIERGIQSGVIRDVDPEILSFFNVAIDEAAMHFASLDNSYSIDQVMRFVGDMLFHAFLTEKGKAVFSTLNRSEPSTSV